MFPTSENKIIDHSHENKIIDHSHGRFSCSLVHIHSPEGTK